MSERMTNETLRERVALELDICGVDTPWRDEYADVALAALGLDDPDAAVERAAAWLYERDRRMYDVIRVTWDEENESFKEMYREQVRDLAHAATEEGQP